MKAIWSNFASNSRREKPIVVGISGPSRGGKTTLLNNLFKLEQIIARKAETGTKYQNWEEPNAIDFNGLSDLVNEGIKEISIPASSPPLVIVEGFLLFAEPLFRKFDKAIFCFSDRETCKRRRFQTKRVPEDYFDEILWPCFVKYNRHLLDWKVSQNGSGLQSLGGDLFVIDTMKLSPEQVTQKALSFINSQPIENRDIPNEISLLQSVFQ